MTRSAPSPITTRTEPAGQDALSTEQALAWFDSLEPVAVESILGSWEGSSIPTGHPMDGSLEALCWHGKRFDSAEEVHPLIFRAADGSLFSVDPTRLPSKPASDPAVLGNPLVAALMRRLMLPLARTTASSARLRMVAHRGQVSAAMVYDKLPIVDVFRRIDDDTLLGVMDMKGAPQPFFFRLRRC